MQIAPHAAGFWSVQAAAGAAAQANFRGRDPQGIENDEKRLQQLATSCAFTSEGKSGKGTKTTQTKSFEVCVEPMETGILMKFNFVYVKLINCNIFRWQ